MVKQVVVKDVFGVVTYFYVDENTGHGFLIDPGSQPEELLHIIRENHWTIEKMLLTHGHFDHIGAVEQLHRELKIPYYIHQNGKKYLEDTIWNLSADYERNIRLLEAQYLMDGQVIPLADNEKMSLRVIETPGHTQDSVIFYSEKEKLAFVGDTIFKGSIGATNFPGSNESLLFKSILYKIFRLPEDTILYSGHSDWTTVGIEKVRHNR